MVNFPTQIPDCHSHSPTLLDLFISSGASICSAMVSLHWEIMIILLSVFIDFPSNSQWDALFYPIAYDYSHADWDGLCDHLKDAPWEGVFRLSPSAAVSELCE